MLCRAFRDILKFCNILETLNKIGHTRFVPTSVCVSVTRTPVEKSDTISPRTSPAPAPSPAAAPARSQAPWTPWTLHRPHRPPERTTWKQIAQACGIPPSGAVQWTTTPRPPPRRPQRQCRWMVTRRHRRKPPPPAPCTRASLPRPAGPGLDPRPPQPSSRKRKNGPPGGAGPT